MTTSERATFGSKFGAILATAGSAVGLGNIWRFPYMLGANGGAAFLLIYLVCVVLLGLPVMISEFYIGKHTHRNAVGAFKEMAPGTKWSLIGYNGVLAAFLILGFYAVVSGWTIEYIIQAFSGTLHGKDAASFQADFEMFSSSTVRPIIWTIAFVLLTHVIIVSGVKDGIERASKVMMPALFLILIALCIRSVTLPGAERGLEFFFNPDFSKITSSVVLSAMGQTFFSLSIGMGCLITYASYFNKATNIQNVALQVTALDTLVSVLAGVMIFPAVFCFGITPTAGPELVFITLPNVFEQLPLGWLWSAVFFILLALAALTSTISLHEVATAYTHEEFKISRTKAAWFVSAGVMVLGIISSLSFGVLKDFTIGGLTFFSLLDYVTAKIMLPLGGMFICIYVGYRVDRKILKAELTNEGTLPFYFFNTYSFFMKYIAPIAIAMIFLNELGLINKIVKFFQ